MTAFDDSAQMNLADSGQDELLHGRAAALVNPASGLANDYLNHFNEIVMLIELLPTMLELADDIMAWCPTSYEAYFTLSPLPGRAVALAAYDQIAPDTRREFEKMVAKLDLHVTGCIKQLQGMLQADPIDQAGLDAYCAKSGKQLRKMLFKTTNLVNHGAAPAGESPQARVDRLVEVYRIRP
jgi:hypothetical protein